MRHTATYSGKVLRLATKSFPSRSGTGSAYFALPGRLSQRCLRRGLGSSTGGARMRKCPSRELPNCWPRPQPSVFLYHPGRRQVMPKRGAFIDTYDLPDCRSAERWRRNCEAAAQTGGPASGYSGRLVMTRNVTTQCAGGDLTSRPGSGQSCEDTHRRDRALSAR
jgi:hypothetical protein